MMEGCLGEESVQMWELNRRLEAYLSRVKSLEEQNERLRLEIGNLRESPGEPTWRSRAEEELRALRILLDQRWGEKHAAEVARDNLLEEVEGVANRCQQQRLARERAKEQVAESRRVLEAEQWAGVCLGNQAAELEKELEAMVASHEQERAGMSAQVARSALSLETFRRAPDNAPAPDVQDLARTFGEAWRGAVEGYQVRVACMEASLGQARESLGQAMQGTREGQREVQRLDVERAALQGRREMLEQRLEGQWQQQQEAGEKFQLAVEALEQEKQDLHNQISQVLEDRQQLMHLKMSLSLEVATYRTLLETESSRLHTSNIDSKATIIFPDPKVELCIPVTPEIRRPGSWPPVLSPTSLPMVDTPRTPMPTFVKSQGFLPTQTPTLASTPIPPISQAHHSGTRREVQAQVAPSYLLQGPSLDGPKPKDSEHLTASNLPWAKAKVGIGVGSSPGSVEPGFEKKQVPTFPCSDELMEQVEDRKNTDSGIEPMEAKDGEEKNEQLNGFSSPQPTAPEPSKHQQKEEKEIQGIAEKEEAKETITKNLEGEAWQKGGALDRAEIQEILRLPCKIQESPEISEEKFQETLRIPGREIKENLNLSGEEILECQKLPHEEFQEAQILPGVEIQKTQKLPSEEVQETHIFPSEEIQETQILADEEIQETQKLPSEEFQETHILPGEELQETQILPDEEIQVTQIPPDEEIQDTQIPPDKEIQGTQIPPDEEIQVTQITPDEEIQGTQILPDEEIQDTQIPPDEQIQDNQIPPDEQIQDTQIPPDEQIRDTQILPDEEIRDTQIPPDEQIRDTQIPPDEQIRDTQILPDEEIRDTQIPPDEQIRDTQIPPDEQIWDTQIPLDEQIRGNQIPPDEQIQDTQIPPDEQIRDTQILPDEEIQGTQIPPDEQIRDNQIPPDEQIRDNQIPPDEQIRDNQIPPDEQIQDTQIPLDEEIRDTHIPPGKKIQDPQIPPDEQVHNTQILPDEEVQENLPYEILKSPEKEIQETLRSQGEDNEEILSSPKEGNLEREENQDSLSSSDMNKQETVSSLEEGVLEKKESHMTLGSTKDNQEIVSSPEDLEREDIRKILEPPEKENQQILKPLKEEIQEILCFSEGNQEREKMQEIVGLPEKEMQEIIRSLDEGNLEMEENQEIPEEGKRDLERKKILQSLEVESLDLQQLEDEAWMGQEHSRVRDEEAPFELGKNQEETAKLETGEQIGLEGNWEVVEETGLKYGGPAESWLTKEEDLGNQESEQKIPAKETIEEKMIKSQVEFREVESLELGVMTEQMLKEDGSFRESDGVTPGNNGSIVGLEPSEGEEVGNQEQLEKEVSESEHLEEELSEPPYREVILETSVEQFKIQTRKDSQESDELNQQSSKLLMENGTHPHLEVPELLAELEQGEFLGMKEDSRFPSDTFSAEITIDNADDKGTTTQSVLIDQEEPQEKTKQEVGVSENPQSPQVEGDPEQVSQSYNSLLKDPQMSPLSAKGNQELWENWETEEPTRPSEELVREIGKTDVQDSSVIFQEEVEESEEDDLSETLPDSTPLGLYSRDTDSPSWGIIGKALPSHQEEHNDAWNSPPRHAEASKAQPCEGEEDEEGAPDSEVSEEFEDLAVDASLFPGGLVETVGHESELVLDHPTWDRDGESDGFADEEESGEEEEDDDDDDDDDDNNDGRGEGMRHWKLGPSLGSAVSYHQEEETKEYRDRNVDVPSNVEEREGAENPFPAVLEDEKEMEPSGRPKSLDSNIQYDSEEEHSHITKVRGESDVEVPLPQNQGLLGESGLTPLDKEDQVSDGDLRVDDSVRKSGASLNGGGLSLDHPDDIRGEILNGLGKPEEAGQGKLWDLERKEGEEKAPGEGLSSSQTLWSGSPLILEQRPFLKFTQSKEEDGDSWSSGDE